MVYIMVYIFDGVSKHMYITSDVAFTKGLAKNCASISTLLMTVSVLMLVAVSAYRLMLVTVSVYGPMLVTVSAYGLMLVTVSAYRLMLVTVSVSVYRLMLVAVSAYWRPPVACHWRLLVAITLLSLHS